MMSLLKAVMRRLGKMVCLFTTPSMGQVKSLPLDANKKLAEYGQQTQDVQEQLQPVQQKRKRGRPAAQPTTVATLQKQTQNPVLAVLGQGGLQQVIRASSLPQPVKSVHSSKVKVAPSTKADLLSQLEQAVAQTPMDLQSGEVGKRKTAASKTRQAVPKASITKPKAAGSTTAAKKRTKKQTPAQTPTGRKSKVRGS